MAINVRYIVTDMDAAVEFYRDQLGFAVDFQAGGGFAMLSKGELKLMLNRPGAGGAGASVGGQAPAPGGWNRFQMEVADLPAEVARLKGAGCEFRSEIIHGNGGDQILIFDPAGNPIELFQPPARG